MDRKSKDERLLKAITSADEASLRAVLLALSAESDDTRDKISDRLLSIEYFNSSTPSTAGVKRKAPSPVYICRRCGDAFDEDNNRKSCLFHSGK